MSKSEKYFFIQPGLLGFIILYHRFGNTWIPLALYTNLVYLIVYRSEKKIESPKPMRIFIISILFLMAGCVGQDENPGDSEEATETPFPRHYKGFYAGMTLKEFNKNAFAEDYFITSEVSKWVKYNYNGVIKGPQICAEHGSIVLVAYVVSNQIARLEFDGDNDPFFATELDDIANSFSTDSRNKSERTFFQDSLKTHVNRNSDELILTHSTLWSEWKDGEEAFNEEIKTEILERYK